MSEKNEFDFSHFGSDVTNVAECPVARIIYPDGSFPILKMVFADPAVNKELAKYIYKLRLENKKPVPKNPIEASAALEELWKKSYAECVIKDWSNVLLQDGTEVPFSKANCLKFLEAINEVQWGEIKDFGTKPENFNSVVTPGVKVKNLKK